MKRLIYTESMAQSLINEGFELIGKFPNARDLRRSVWVFNSSPELEKACNEYIAASKQAKRPVQPVQVDDKLICCLYYKKDMTVAEICRMCHVDKQRVLDAVRNDQGLLDAFRIASLDREDFNAYRAAQTDEERRRILDEKASDYIVHSSQGNRTFVHGKEVAPNE